MRNDDEPQFRSASTYPRSDRKYVRDMLAHIGDARQIVDLGEEAFLDPASTIPYRAAKSVIIDLSSAADRLSSQFKQAHPNIPWSPLHKMRSLLAHEHIQRPIVWDTLISDLPKIEAILQPFHTGEGTPEQ